MPVLPPGSPAVVPGSAGAAPCGWTVEVPCDEAQWLAFSATVRAAATAYATELLYALTGRQFSACEVLVRPCGSRCRGGGWETFPVTSDGYGGVAFGWMSPYTWGGTWLNCACGGVCRCEARCQVWLPGPVASVLSVTVDGVVLAPTSYRIDNQDTLVRTDGGCFPECQNFDLSSPTDDGTFFVEYTRGRAVPTSAAVMAGIVAMEFAKYCAGGDCRLPRALTSLVRQGAEITLPDMSDVANDGLTGIPEVDVWIRAVNPHRQAQAARVWSPDVHYPRQVV